MNGAQRAAFNTMTAVADDMATVMYELTVRPAISAARYANISDLYRRWMNARARYFELEREAKQSRLTAQQMARKSSARKSG